VPRSKNAWSYTSTPPMRLHGVVLSQKSTGTTPHSICCRQVTYVKFFLSSELHYIGRIYSFIFSFLTRFSIQFSAVNINYAIHWISLKWFLISSSPIVCNFVQPLPDYENILMDVKLHLLQVEVFWVTTSNFTLKMEAALTSRNVGILSQHCTASQPGRPRL
jgi:hypothetical protein